MRHAMTMRLMTEETDRRTEMMPSVNERENSDEAFSLSIKKIHISKRDTSVSLSILHCSLRYVRKKNEYMHSVVRTPEKIQIGITD